MTTWRIYSAYVEQTSEYYEVTTYNMFDRLVDVKRVETESTVQDLIDSYKKIEPKFESNW